MHRARSVTVSPDRFKGVKKKARRVGRASYAILVFQSDLDEPSTLSGDGRTGRGLEGLFVRDGCLRQLGDIGLLAVMETTAKGDGRGDDRESKDDAHN